MKKLILLSLLLASPAFAKDYVIQEISDPTAQKPYYFSPDTLTIQPNDTVTFVNAQDDTHDIMFTDVPAKADAMIMSPTLEKKGDHWAYTFTIPGTYRFHCHPHEELGMTGVLIVGQASPKNKKLNPHATKE